MPIDIANPLRMSVTPEASHIFVFTGTGITPTDHGSKGERLGIVGTVDPEPVPARNVNLDHARD